MVAGRMKARVILFAGLQKERAASWVMQQVERCSRVTGSDCAVWGSCNGSGCHEGPAARFCASDLSQPVWDRESFYTMVLAMSTAGVTERKKSCPVMMVQSTNWQHTFFLSRPSPIFWSARPGCLTRGKRSQPSPRQHAVVPAPDLLIDTTWRAA